MDNPPTKYTKKVLVAYIEHIERRLADANEEIRQLLKELGREAPPHNPNQLEFNFHE